MKKVFFLVLVKVAIFNLFVSCSPVLNPVQGIAHNPGFAEEGVAISKESKALTVPIVPVVPVAPIEIYVPTAKMNLLHTEQFSSGNEVSFYEIDLEPGFIITKEKILDNVKPLVVSSRMTISQIYEAGGKKIPEALIQANKLQIQFMLENGIIIYFPATTTASAVRAAILSPFETWKAAHIDGLKNYTYGRKYISLSGNREKGGDHQYNRRHGARIYYKQAAGSGATMYIAVRKFNKWKTDKYEYITDSITWRWTMPDTHNNYDYSYEAQTGDGYYCSMYCMAGFDD